VDANFVARSGKPSSVALKGIRFHSGCQAWVAAIGVGLSDDVGWYQRYVTYGELIQPASQTAGLYDEGYRQFRDHTTPSAHQGRIREH